MPDFGAPVAQNVTGPNVQTLSDVMNFKQKQLDLQRSQDTYAADVARSQADSSLAQTNASVAQQTAAPKVAQQVAQTGLDQFKLTGAQAAQSMQLASGLISDPDFMKGNGSAMVDKLNGAQDTMVKQFGVDPKIADATITTLKYQALHSPQQVRQSLINMTQQQQGGAGQQAAALPSPVMVNDGQKVQPQTQGNEALTGVAPGMPVGGSTQLQPPPTMSVINPKTGASELYGAHPVPPSGPIATSLPPGAAGNMENNVNEMNRHFATLQDTSTGAPLVNALRGNIKALGGAAITGTESDRKAYMNGLFNAFGLGDKASGDMQTDTDLLSKQLAQLNLTSPASSDAARALIGAARPNSHMTAAAQSEAADQFASQVQANMAIRNKLAPLKMSNNGQGDPVAYQAQRQQLEQIADPRAWQYMNLGPGTPAAKQFLSKLKPADKAKLGASVDALEKAGMLQ